MPQVSEPSLWSPVSKELRGAYSRVLFKRTLGHLLFIPFSGLVILALKHVVGVRIRNKAEWRAQYEEWLKVPSPLLICSNHLTYIDSIILIYAFGTHLWYQKDFRRLSWNLPAAQYARNPFFWLVGLLCKCIFIDRKGTRKHHAEVLGSARTLMERGEVFTIFPEGRRSKTGRFDDERLAYGIGKIVTQLDHCRVACLYLRAAGQEGQSKFPKRGSEFVISMKMKEFRRDERPDSARVPEVLREIAAEIKGLESQYFAAVPAR